MTGAILLSLLLFIEHPLVSLSLAAGDYEGALTARSGDAVVMGKISFTIMGDSRIERFKLDMEQEQIVLERLPGNDWLVTTTPKVDSPQVYEQTNMKRAPITEQVIPNVGFQAAEYKIRESAPNCFVFESDHARVIASKSSLVVEASTWQPAALIFWAADTKEIEPERTDKDNKSP